MKRTTALILISFIAALFFVLSYLLFGHLSNMIFGIVWIGIGSLYVRESRR